NNWELSAARAISVVQYLIGKGVSPQRLVAAGFGEFQPIDVDKTEDAFGRNRRIELKLTERGGRFPCRAKANGLRLQSPGTRRLIGHSPCAPTPRPTRMPRSNCGGAPGS